MKTFFSGVLILFISSVTLGATYPERDVYSNQYGDFASGQVVYASEVLPNRNPVRGEIKMFNGWGDAFIEGAGWASQGHYFAVVDSYGPIRAGLSNAFVPNENPYGYALYDATVVEVYSDGTALVQDSARGYRFVTSSNIKISTLECGPLLTRKKRP